jgi:hypothetical protein
MSTLGRSIVIIALITTVVMGMVYPAVMPGRLAFQAQVEAWAQGDRLRAVPPMGERGEGGSLEARGDWLARDLYPTGRIPAGDWQTAALRQLERLPNGIPGGMQTVNPGVPSLGVIPPLTTTWTAMGPMPLDYNTATAGYKYGIANGRMNAITFVPGSATTAYAGGPVGGLWKTTNCCSSATTWTPLWDAATFGAQSVGAIAVDPNNTNVVYVGTGDSQVPAFDMYGNGIFKSTDAGATWTQYGASLFSPYGSAGAPGSTCCVQAPDENIRHIVVHPGNSNIVIVGASYGIFISWDAGVTWTQYDVVNRTMAPYSDDAQRVTGLLVDGPTNTMYVALGYPYTSVRRPGLTGGSNGMFKAPIPTSPGAPTFTPINSGWPANTGTGNSTTIGRIELAWNTAHTRIYAAASDYSTTTLYGIYTAASPFTTWTLLANTSSGSFVDCQNSNETSSAQDWYDLLIGVDPLNDRTVYVGRVDFYKATIDSLYTTASTRQSLGDVYAIPPPACGGYGKLHPDQHAFAWVPTSNPSTFVVGNDGGLYFGTGAVGGFTQMNNTLATMQFYAGQLGRDFANTSGTQVQYMFGGFQDNGNASWTSANTNFTWQSRGNGGDGFFTAFDPIVGTTSTGRWYTEYVYGALSCSTTGAAGGFGGCAPGYTTQYNTGIDRRDWSTPYMLDQWNCTATQCDNLILGTSRIWASVDTTGAPTWTNTGTTNLTKGAGTIIALNVAHKNPGSVIVGTSDGNVEWSNNVFTGANCTAAVANTATFVCAVNGASTWVNLTGSNAVLPNRAISGVAFDPNTNLIFYAAVGGFNANTPGFNGHLFRGVCSTNPCTTANITWTPKDGGLPDMPFYAVQVNPNLPNQVFVGTALGLYYTNDITAADPVWYNFANGMPRTRVQYLTVDRGPGTGVSALNSTTISAFTYGRGAFMARLGAAYTPTAIETRDASVNGAAPAFPLVLVAAGLALGALALLVRRFAVRG